MTAEHTDLEHEPAPDPAPDHAPRPAWSLEPAALFAAIFIVALLVRLLVLYQINHDPQRLQVGGDGIAYLKWAHEITAGDWIGHSVFYPSPLYPYLLAIFDKTVGLDLVPLLIAQAILGAIGCGILALAARLMFDLRAGAIAGVLISLYPSAISYDLQVDKTVLDPLLTALLLWSIARIVRQPTRLGWLLCGIVIGVFSLTRENALALAVPILLWALWHFRAEPARSRGVWVLMTIAGILCIVFPVCLRNSMVGGEFHLSTAKFGANFYYGNAAKADGIYFPLRPGRGDLRYEQIDATELAEKDVGRKLSPAEISNYWTHLTLHDIKAEPARWIKLSLRKFAMFWCDTEIADADVHERHVVYSPVLRALDWLWGFRVLLPLAVLGAALIWRANRSLVILIGSMALVYAVAIAAFILFGRYRIAVVPMLVPLAAGGLIQLLELATQKRWTILLIGAALAACAVGVVYLGEWSIPLRIRGTNPYNRANLFSALGQLDLADSHYRQAIRENPTLEPAYVNYSLLKSDRGQAQEAQQLAEQAIALDPKDPSARASLGVAFARAGKTEESLEAFDRARRLDPSSRAMRYNYAAALYQAGRRDEAIPVLREIAAMQPPDDFARRAQKMLAP